MSNQELFKQVEHLLQRQLTPEECKFLALASEVLQKKEGPPRKTPTKNTKIVA